MKISPVCLAACAIVALAPVPANAKPACNRNPDVLRGTAVILKDNGEWCELDTIALSQFNQRNETGYQARRIAEKRAQLVYENEMARYQGTPIGTATALVSQIANSMGQFAANQAQPEPTE
jgi:hypothetical protein